MENNEATNLDEEFEKYLLLLRPYLGQLDDENVIKVCNAWIQRLSKCNENEKVLRNRYIFLLCYQISSGVLDFPFLKDPPVQLQALPDDVNSDDESSEVEYIVINSNSNESKTKILYDTKKIVCSETENLSKEDNKIWGVNAESERSVNMGESGAARKQTILCYHCPKINQSEKETANDEYEFRANNLVQKLRNIKMQNILLQKELLVLKEVVKSHDDFSKEYTKVDNTTSTFVPCNNSNTTLKSLKCQLQEIQESRNILIETISNLQNQLDNFNELKKNEIEDIEAKHKLELIKVRTDAREETKLYYEKRFEDIKQSYEETIAKIQEPAINETKKLTESKDKIIFEKNMSLDAKTKQIEALTNQMEAQKINMQSMLNKFIDKSTEDSSIEGLKIKNQLLEKRLNKIEKAKIKHAKVYEAKLIQLQREKHLAECSLQLQLVRQRAQMFSELTEENQTELNTSLDKLENKYKEIVANVQATAIQRRIQDQKPLEAILQAVCDADDPNQSYTFSNLMRNHNQTCDSENASITRARTNKIGNITLGNKSFGENSTVPGFCLSGERMGELFEKLYIPQRDNSNGESK